MKNNALKSPVPRSKKQKAWAEKVTLGRVYSFAEAVAVLKSLPAKFDESVDVAIILGVDPKKSDQVVRSATVLPNGVGKTVRVAVFTQGANVEVAKAAGADRVGMDDLAQEMQSGQLDYDVIIASPDAMGLVGRLGPVLGPRGLMPNPKVGTVSMDVAQAVRNAKGGQVRYRTDKNGILHCSIGKLSFQAQALQENLAALLADVKKIKPSTSKGIYLRKVSLSSTMGPGLVLELSSI